MENEVDICEFIENRPPDALILDVRERITFSHGNIEGSVNVPLDELSELYSLPRDKGYTSTVRRIFSAARWSSFYGTRGTRRTIFPAGTENTFLNTALKRRRCDIKAADPDGPAALFMKQARPW